MTTPNVPITQAASEPDSSPSLWAISDLHVGYPENRAFVDRIRPATDRDWLIVAGDVAERFDDIVGTLRELRSRFHTVIWSPGNHELWTLPGDPVAARGVARYLRLVDALREIAVTTPEDPYPTWEDNHGPIVIAPLFLLFDYTFRPPGARSKDEAMTVAKAAGVLCTDELLLHPDPYPTREAWSAARLEQTRSRLEALPTDARSVLVNHWPLVREPTQRLRHPEFALWCGTEHTADWPARYRADVVVHGHLHIPVTTTVDGIPHHEVSLGYPHEWDQVGALPRRVRRILGGPDPERGP